MATDYLPPEDHALRYVKKKNLRKDEDGNVLGILPQALELRPGEEYPSITWMEHFSPDYETGFAAAANAIRNQLAVKKNDGFSAANVENISNICAQHEVNVRITHEPLPDNTGHSGIRRFIDDDIELLDELAEEVFVDTRISSTVP